MAKEGDKPGNNWSTKRAQKPAVPDKKFTFVKGKLSEQPTAKHLEALLLVCSKINSKQDVGRNTVLDQQTKNKQSSLKWRLNS